MTPLPAFLAVTAALVAAAGVGVVAGRWQKGREYAAERARLLGAVADLAIDNARLAADNSRLGARLTHVRGSVAYLQGQVAEAESAVTELREAIPKVWDAGVAAARQMRRHDPDDGIQVWEMSPEFAERLRSNRRQN